MKSATDNGGGGSLHADIPQAAIRQIVTRTILIISEMSYKKGSQATDTRNGAYHSTGDCVNIVGEFAIRPSTFCVEARYLN